MDRGGTIASGQAYIEPGDNTLLPADPASGWRFQIYRNGGDTGAGFEYASGTSGARGLTGPTPIVTYAPGDRISLVPVPYGAMPPTSGYIRAPRCTLLTEDT